MASWFLGFIPLLNPVMFLAVSSLLFLDYGLDKRAAERGIRRVPENTLHLLALLGGWPGAFIAQQTFHHKTRKVSFQWDFWLTVCTNTVLLGWLHTPAGAELLLGAQLAVLRALVVDALGPGQISEWLIRVLSHRLIS